MAGFHSPHSLTWEWGRGGKSPLGPTDSTQAIMQNSKSWRGSVISFHQHPNFPPRIVFDFIMLVETAFFPVICGYMYIDATDLLRFFLLRELGDSDCWYLFLGRFPVQPGWTPDWLKCTLQRLVRRAGTRWETIFYSPKTNKRLFVAKISGFLTQNTILVHMQLSSVLKTVNVLKTVQKTW